MKNVKSKFENLIRSLQYDCIKLTSIDVEEIKEWSYANMPLVIEEMVLLGWDLTDDTTWLENTFSNHVLTWYDKRIAVFVTPSLYDFNLCQRVLRTKTFANFREHFKLDLHLALLVHPVIFIKPYDLDDIFVNFDFEKGWSVIDYSHCDEEGELEPSYQEEWGWLEYGDADEWDATQVAKAYKEEVYAYSEIN